MPKRNHALDLLRGLTIALMIVVNNPGDWKQMFQVLRHAEWDGFLGADIVFPLFLFVSGFAAALKIDRLLPITSSGPHCATALTLDTPDNPPYYLPLLRRSLILFAIGLFLNAWPLGLLPGTEFIPSNLRVWGVLQRIAVCVFFGGLLMRKIQSPKGMVLTLVALAAIYEIGMRLPSLQTAHGTFGRSFALADNFARYVDISILPEALLYKIQKISFDPEGLFTTITALMTFLTGGLCFRWSRHRFALAGGLAALGLILLTLEPVNKNLWTLPYVLLTGGAGVLLLTLLEKITWGENNGRSRIAGPFARMGQNPLVIYILSGIFGKALALTKMTSGLSLKALLFSSMALLPVSGKILSLLYSLILLLVLAWLARFMRRYYA